MMRRSFRIRSMHGLPYQLIMGYEDGSQIVIKESYDLQLIAGLCDKLNAEPIAL